MDYKSFIKQTVSCFSLEWIESIEDLILGRFIFYSFISKEEITGNVLAEKLSDYFEKVEIKTGKTFDKLLSLYMTNLDLMVGRNIADTPKPKKGNDIDVVVPRTRKYYEKALSFMSQVPTVRSLTDYTRLMMCLYSAIISNEHKTIRNFDYSIDCLDIDKILYSMEKEVSFGILQKSKSMFNFSDIYSTDAATFVLLVIMLTMIKNEEVKDNY